jgi:hypothetical protein
MKKSPMDVFLWDRKPRSDILNKQRCALDIFMCHNFLHRPKNDRFQHSNTDPGLTSNGSARHGLDKGGGLQYRNHSDQPKKWIAKPVRISRWYAVE